MKIEMGESLFYSWLRHVKECQIVQTNWKVSPKWDFKNADEIDKLLNELNTYFDKNYQYKVFKKNASLSQIIQQGECDVLGINMQDGISSYYAVDVAFHESGLNYGSKEETVLKVLAKSIRTAFCLYGYFNTKSAEIVFASPKINNPIWQNATPLIEFINRFFKEKGFEFNFRIICNEDFTESILKPILLISKDVADTSELFMRAYQLLAMFEPATPKAKTVKPVKSVTFKDWTKEPNVYIDYSTESDAYKELKIGQIARTVLKDILESGKVSEREIADMQTIDYSKKTFDIQYPLLTADRNRHYYANPLKINGKTYFLCCEWFENDRRYLLNWIKTYNK